MAPLLSVLLPISLQRKFEVSSFKQGRFEEVLRVVIADDESIAVKEVLEESYS